MALFLPNWYYYMICFNINILLQEIWELNLIAQEKGFQQDRGTCILVHKNLSGMPFYGSKGSKDPSSLVQSKSLQYEGTQNIPVSQLFFPLVVSSRTTYTDL